MLYSVERVMRTKDKAGGAKERERVRQTAGRGSLGGLTVVAYTPGGHLGSLKVRQYGKTLRRAERNRTTTLVQSYHERGRDLKDLPDDIGT